MTCRSWHSNLATKALTVASHDLLGKVQKVVEYVGELDGLDKASARCDIGGEA